MTRSSSARLKLNSVDSARLGIEEIRCWTINRRDSPANERLSGAVPWSEQATSRVSRSELVVIQSARVPNWDVENWWSPVLIFICRSERTFCAKHSLLDLLPVAYYASQHLMHRPIRCAIGPDTTCRCVAPALGRRLDDRT